MIRIFGIECCRILYPILVLILFLRRRYGQNPCHIYGRSADISSGSRRVLGVIPRYSRALHNDIFLEIQEVFHCQKTILIRCACSDRLHTCKFSCGNIFCRARRIGPVYLKLRSLYRMIQSIFFTDLQITVKYKANILGKIILVICGIQEELFGGCRKAARSYSGISRKVTVPQNIFQVGIHIGSVQLKRAVGGHRIHCAAIIITWFSQTILNSNISANCRIHPVCYRLIISGQTIPYNTILIVVFTVRRIRQRRRSKTFKQISVGRLLRCIPLLSPLVSGQAHGTRSQQCLYRLITAELACSCVKRSCVCR